MTLYQPYTALFTHCQCRCCWWHFTNPAHELFINAYSVVVVSHLCWHTSIIIKIKGAISLLHFSHLLVFCHTKPGPCENPFLDKSYQINVEQSNYKFVMGNMTVVVVSISAQMVLRVYIISIIEQFVIFFFLKLCNTNMLKFIFLVTLFLIQLWMFSVELLFTTYYIFVGMLVGWSRHCISYFKI